MAVSYLELEDNYNVKTDDKPISIEVEVGNGQSGAYVIFLGKKLKGTNSPAPLGQKADVKGQKATIATTVADTLQETNWTSVTVYVIEGENRTTFGPYKKQAAQHLDTIIYTLQILFS